MTDPPKPPPLPPPKKDGQSGEEQKNFNMAARRLKMKLAILERKK